MRSNRSCSWESSSFSSLARHWVCMASSWVSSSPHRLAKQPAYVLRILKTKVSPHVPCRGRSVTNAIVGLLSSPFYVNKTSHTRIKKEYEENASLTWKCVYLWLERFFLFCLHDDFSPVSKGAVNGPIVTESKHKFCAEPCDFFFNYFLVTWTWTF